MKRTAIAGDCFCEKGGWMRCLLAHTTCATIASRRQTAAVGLHSDATLLN